LSYARELPARCIYSRLSPVLQGLSPPAPSGARGDDPPQQGPIGPVILLAIDARALGDDEVQAGADPDVLAPGKRVGRQIRPSPTAMPSIKENSDLVAEAMFRRASAGVCRAHSATIRPPRTITTR